MLALQARADMIATIERIKPSIVAVGTLMKTRSPSVVYSGTGFAVADGRHVVTNAHVIPKALDAEKKEALIVLISQAGEPQARQAELVSIDRDFDLALLKISGEPLPPLTLGDSTSVREGKTLAFTGFPLGMVLGYHPATHRGIVSAITPIVGPGMSARQLSAASVNRMRGSAYTVFQLDATAYPGNSGSPLYDPDSAAVYGIINMVFVKSTKESAITSPSGITYAIPATYIIDLLRRQNLIQ